MNECFPPQAAGVIVDDVQGWEGDEEASALYPTNAPQSLIPLQVAGDGNCCPSASLHMQGETCSGNAL